VSLASAAGCGVRRKAWTPTGCIRGSNEWLRPRGQARLLPGRQGRPDQVSAGVFDGGGQRTSASVHPDGIGAVHRNRAAGWSLRSFNSLFFRNGHGARQAMPLPDATPFSDGDHGNATTTPDWRKRRPAAPREAPETPDMTRLIAVWVMPRAGRPGLYAGRTDRRPEAADLEAHGSPPLRRSDGNASGECKASGPGDNCVV